MYARTSTAALAASIRGRRLGVLATLAFFSVTAISCGGGKTDPPIIDTVKGTGGSSPGTGGRTSATGGAPGMGGMTGNGGQGGTTAGGAGGTSLGGAGGKAGAGGAGSDGPTNAGGDAKDATTTTTGDGGQTDTTGPEGDAKSDASETQMMPVSSCGPMTGDPKEWCDQGSANTKDTEVYTSKKPEPGKKICNSKCQLVHYCGDELFTEIDKQGKEECDSGAMGKKATLTAPGCTDTCKLIPMLVPAMCGNKVKEAGEDCDDPSGKNLTHDPERLYLPPNEFKPAQNPDPATKKPPVLCSKKCHVVGYCGDGKTDKTNGAAEACDEGAANTANTDTWSLAKPSDKACNVKCEKITAYCGDNLVQKDKEECEPGVPASFNPVSHSCNKECKAVPHGAPLPPPPVTGQALYPIEVWNKQCIATPADPAPACLEAFKPNDAVVTVSCGDPKLASKEKFVYTGDDNFIVVPVGDKPFIGGEVLVDTTATNPTVICLLKNPPNQAQPLVSAGGKKWTLAPNCYREGEKVVRLRVFSPKPTTPADAVAPCVPIKELHVKVTVAP